MVAAIVIVVLVAVPWLDPSYRFLSIATSTGISDHRPLRPERPVRAGRHHVGRPCRADGRRRLYGAILARDLGINFWLGAAASALVVSALVAGLLGLPSLRVSGHHFVIITFAFCGLLTIILTNGGSFTGAATGLDIGPIGSILGVNFDKLQNSYLLIVGFVLVSIAVDLSDHRSRPMAGRSARSARTSSSRASVGINVGLHKIVAFMVSGVFAGVAGVLQAYFLQHISPDLYGAFPSVYLALMVMLGGPRMLYGPLGRRDHRQLPAGGPESRPGRLPHRLRRRPDRGHPAPAGRRDGRPASSLYLALRARWQRR